MSLENVDKFYQLLEEDPALRDRALSFQHIYSEQEQVLDAFIALAEECCLPFTQNEFMTVMFQRATAQDGQTE